MPVTKDGYYTDKYIYTMPMPKIQKGKNVLIVRVPFGKRISMENMFLLGGFGVKAEGCNLTVTALPEKLAFGSVTAQGMPFYGSTVTYKTEFELDRACNVAIRTEFYKGALLRVKVDGKDLGPVAFAPFRAYAEGLEAGKHTMELTLYATRVNSFNGLHNCGKMLWTGPSYWYTSGVEWSYEYQLKEIGVMKSPVIELYDPDANTETTKRNSRDVFVV